MKDFSLVCVGGALGSGLRYLTSSWLNGKFPFGTLAVNLIGSFLIVVIMRLSVTGDSISPSARLFLTTGIMGGFTTYSSFNYETFRFFQEGSFGVGALYLFGTISMCLLGAFLAALVIR